MMVIIFVLGESVFILIVYLRICPRLLCILPVEHPHHLLLGLGDHQHHAEDVERE